MSAPRDKERRDMVSQCIVHSIVALFEQSQGPEPPVHVLTVNRAQANAE